MKFKVSKTYETWDEQALEAGETDDKGFEYQDEVMTLRELVRELRNNGITEPSCSHVESARWFSSVDPVHDRAFFEKGEYTYYSVHPANMDGTDISGRNMKRIARLTDYRVRLWN